eukprot:TRINITY_DN7778_c0_g1_i1.p1 TRINITY_DN7778_c0_g1~~TRINITY_DN7778_c0_g1_i1.p1  ORF type:complete len:678 (+),score=40.96 TRINITY_DN7778_c0_g1_i1:166-2199(+)
MIAVVLCLALVATARHIPASQTYWMKDTFKNESFVLEQLSSKKSMSVLRQETTVRCTGRRRRTLQNDPSFKVIGGSVCLNGQGSIWDGAYCLAAHKKLKLSPKWKMSVLASNPGGCHAHKFYWKGNLKKGPKSICMRPTKPKGLFRENVVYFQKGTKVLSACGKKGISWSLAFDNSMGTAHRGSHGFIVSPVKNRLIIHHAEQVHLTSTLLNKMKAVGARKAGCGGGLVKRGSACLGVGTFPKKGDKTFVLVKKAGRGQFSFGSMVGVINPAKTVAIQAKGKCCKGVCTGGLKVEGPVALKKHDSAFFKLGFTLHQKGFNCCRNPFAKMWKCTLAGDPHIKTFDNRRINIYDKGLFWIVKNDCSTVQAIYVKWANGNGCIGSLAFGGNAYLGHRVKIGARQRRLIYWDNKGVRSLNHVLTAKAKLTGRTWKLFGPCRLISFSTFNGAGKVQWMDMVLLLAKQVGGTDGHCGNLNGNLADDTVAAIRGRKAFAVGACWSLFARVIVEKRFPRLKLKNCPAPRRRLVLRKCKLAIKRTTANFVALRKGCALDGCFVTLGVVKAMKKTVRIKKKVVKLRKRQRIIRKRVKRVIKRIIIRRQERGKGCPRRKIKIIRRPIRHQHQRRMVIHHYHHGMRGIRHFRRGFHGRRFFRGGQRRTRRFWGGRGRRRPCRPCRPCRR